MSYGTVFVRTAIAVPVSYWLLGWPSMWWLVAAVWCFSVVEAHLDEVWSIVQRQQEQIAELHQKQYDREWGDTA